MQLTRDPDSLASALERLALTTVSVPASDGLAFLFATWRPTAPAQRGPGAGLFTNFQPSTAKRLERLRAQGAALRTGRPSPKTAAWVMIAAALVLGPIAVLAGALSLVALFMMLVLDVAFMSVALIATDAVLGLVFAYAPVVILKYIPLLVHHYLPRLVHAIRTA